MTRALRRFHCFVALSAWIAFLASATAWAAATPWAGDARGSARLITAVEATGSSTRLDAALELRLAPGWHTYWRTPGDAGFPAAIDWTGSENLASADMSWPAPRRLTIEGLENIVYLDHVVLPVALTVTDPGKPVRLRAEVDYASCEKVCIPYHASLDLTLPAGLAVPGPEASLIAKAAAKVPGSLSRAGLRLLSATVSGPNGATSSLAITLADDADPLMVPDLFVEGMPQATPPQPAVLHGAAGRAMSLVLPLSAETARIALGKQLTFTVVDGVRSAEFTATPTLGPPPTNANSSGIMAILGAALLGGLILNVMPCVLPVLSLKLLGVAGYAGAERRRVRFGLLATASGVVGSFLAIAAVLAGLKLAGAAVGWGIQFQQPWFLAGMAAVTTLFAASLWGVLPIGVPGFAAAAAGIRPRNPMLDAFAAGAFATLMATSCSAPFVGTAVGFALARGPAEIMLIFTSLGLGMAAPLLAVAAAPGLVRFLPRPGAWMVWLRQVLGSALAGTALWLLWVLAQVAGPKGATLAGLALVALVAALAMQDRFVGAWRRVARGAAMALVAVSMLIPELTAAPPSQPASNEGQAIQWQSFDPARIRRDVAAGKLVFVDVTAAWCLTCKVNEAAVLDRTPVAGRLANPGVVAMRADWTRPEPQITAYLKSFGRYGVPLDVVYGPARPDGEALPELLSASAVLGEIERAVPPPPKTLTER